ncbi:MAG TPA: riboflavin synthase [Acidimicrobiales bacterium]|nr:riboflavin synthase [Acidimicrobiales bacterium]
MVEELGRVRAVGPDGRLAIEASVLPSSLIIGSSIAVNGCCLTAVEVGPDGFVVQAVPETLSRTNLGDLGPGSEVNLERPLAVDGRLDGHLVQGHVDGTGEVISPAPDLRVAAPPEVLRYLIVKGSITVDGISLTVVDVDEGSFTVAVIPHTAAVTTLGRRQVGERVNLEVDLIGKYVERLLSQAGRL